MRIYKYDIPINGSIMLPAGSQILSVGIQDDQVRVWILLDPDAPKTEACAFRVVGTGWDVDRDSLGIFIGTVRDGGFVWHVFARGVATIAVSAEDQASAPIKSVIDAIAELAQADGR